MDNISIVNRELSAEELDQLNSGFDELSREEGIELESSERFSFVANRAGNFVGGASGSASKNGESYSGWFYLADLYVEKESRSQGLGTLLLTALESELADVGIKHIWLWTSGDKALKFYRTNNYYQFAEMEHWYSDGSSRIGLRKDL